ncbi:hypothetical protein Tco_0908270 [Tanacetum coccineum]|uniref:Uncharacterized protein n=1 Tax=Tanacetum coccineum TaxID=301880 RepID=A0ABQ5CLW7_9ASTR
MTSKCTSKLLTLSWEEIFCENAIGLVGNRDHLNKCYAHMLYCIITKQPYNLAYYVVKRIENVKSQHNKVIPYGMLLTRLFHYAMSTYPHLAGPYYRVVDRKMAPIGGPHVRKTRSDIGGKHCHSVSLSSTFRHGSSSHFDNHNEENDEGNEGTSNSHHFPSSFYNSLLNTQNKTYLVPIPEEENMREMMCRQTIMMNRQTFIHMEHQGALKAIGKAFRNLGKYIKKKFK